MWIKSNYSKLSLFAENMVWYSTELLYAINHTLNNFGKGSLSASSASLDPISLYLKGGSFCPNVHHLRKG